MKLHTFWSISKQTRIFLEKRFYNRFSYRCLHILKVHLSPQPHSFLLGLRLEVICFPSQGCVLRFSISRKNQVVVKFFISISRPDAYDSVDRKSVQSKYVFMYLPEQLSISSTRPVIHK